MITALALSLTLSALDPALAGGSNAVPPPPEGTVVLERQCQIVLESGQENARGCPRIVTGQARRREQRHTSSTRPITHNRQQFTSTTHQRRTVTLSDGFFVGGLTGGVEQPQAHYRVYGYGYVVIGGSHAPVSAGQAAAARGLPRASH